VQKNPNTGLILLEFSVFLCNADEDPEKEAIQAATSDSVALRHKPSSQLSRQKSPRNYSFWVLFYPLSVSYALH